MMNGNGGNRIDLLEFVLSLRVGQIKNRSRQHQGFRTFSFLNKAMIIFTSILRSRPEYWRVNREE